MMIEAVLFLVMLNWTGEELSRFPPECECRRLVQWLYAVETGLEEELKIAPLGERTRDAASDVEHLRSLRHAWTNLAEAQRWQNSSNVFCRRHALEPLARLQRCLSDKDYAAGRMPLPRWYRH